MHCSRNCRKVRFRRPPPVSPEALAELECRGVDAVRASLWHAAAGDKLGLPAEPHLQTLFTLRNTDFGSVSITRAEGERWLIWKARHELMWVKVGTIAAVLAALFALGSWLWPIAH